MSQRIINNCLREAEKSLRIAIRSVQEHDIPHARVCLRLAAEALKAADLEPSEEV